MLKKGQAILCLLVGIVGWFALSSFHDGDSPKKHTKKEKISRLGEYQGYSDKVCSKFDYTSHYIPMKDDVKLAVDVYLPQGVAESKKKVPTIVYFVRYVRTMEAKGIFKLFAQPFFGHVKGKEIDFFTQHGYACMIVDLRGSGASFGCRQMEFSPQEVADMSEVLDWAVQQPWSDGQTATTGVSYTGTTAELALSTQHPSLKACIPRCNIFDLYTDMCFPGGVRHSPFVDVWKQTTEALDLNQIDRLSKLAKLAVRGINPVHGDKDRALLAEALEDHSYNFDIFSGIFRVECRDDVDSILTMPIDQFSIHNRIREIEQSKVPLYRISGWYDGACVNSTIKAYLNIRTSEKLLIGPWDHGPHEHISPFTKSNKYDFAMYEEMLRFFDYHLKGIDNGIAKEPRVHYYQMGAEEFRSSEVWPPLGFQTETFYLNEQNSLSQDMPQGDKKSDYRCDYTVGTGGQSRWNSLTPLYRNGDTEYNGRAEMNKKMLCFDAPAAAEDREITGHPVVELYLSADAEDVQLFAYLEDVAPDGSVTYITEGMLRAAHRHESSEPRPYQWAGPYHTFNRSDMQPLRQGEVAKMSFDLIPTSYLLRAGHRLRLSIAAADVDHFDLNNITTPNLSIHHSPVYRSKVEVPMMTITKNTK